MSRKNIYLDHAATTPVDGKVLEAMEPYFSEKFGNPSSIHGFGQEAIAAIDGAREKIARNLNCRFEEIIFTGSATEANNLAVFGIAKKGSRAVTTAIEHESILEPIRKIEKNGCKITRLKVSKDGLIKISDLEKNIKNNTVLVSVIYANNEIGTVQPIKEAGKLIEKINIKRKESGLSKIYFHTDAVQALNFLECRPDWLKADLMTFSGHKIYGPKGIGALYARKGTPLSPVIFGGGQEFGIRSGTENVPHIAGFAQAVETAIKNREKNFQKILDLRNQMLKSIIKYNRDFKINGSLSSRTPNNLNLRFSEVKSEDLIIALDQAGIAVSAGSACSSRDMAASHVLKAIGLSDKEARESIRITLGKDTSRKEIEKAAEIIAKTAKSLKNNRL